MPKFKGYHKKATSDKMMRIIKRERILSFIIAGGGIERKNKTPEGMKRSDMDWHDANLTEMILTEHIGNKDFFDWKVSLIEETGWLKNLKVINHGEYLTATASDTRKLRIYYNWLHKANKFTLENVLKYMYSPLFPAMLVVNNSGMTREGELMIDTCFYNGNSSELLAQWFDDILNIKPIVIKCMYGPYLKFSAEDSEKLIELIEPILKESPSVYERLCLTWSSQRSKAEEIV